MKRVFLWRWTMIDRKIIEGFMKEVTAKDVTPTPPNGLTKEELFFWRLQNDFAWYSSNFLKIRSKKNELVGFKLNKSQAIFEAVDQYCIANGIMRRYIVLKARQLGMSTYTEGKIFQETTTNSFVRSMIIAHEDQASTNLFNMSKLFYDEIPQVISPMRKYNNGKILSFENPSNDEADKRGNPGLRSSITIATAGAVEVGRSATPSKLHISELAFFPNAATTMTGLLQGVPDTLNTLVVLESTANGVGDFFHKFWKESERGENDFIPLFFPWFIEEEYSKEFRSEGEREKFREEIEYISIGEDGNSRRTHEYNLMQKHDLTLEQLNWRRWAIKNKCHGDETKFRQEYPSTPEEAFITSGRPQFPFDVLKEYQTITRSGTRGYLFRKESGELEFIEDKFGYLEIFNMPVVGMEYAIGADVAEGLAKGDYSCAAVGNIGTFTVDCVWHGHIAPDLLGEELMKLGEFYNYASIGVENNNHGHSTLNTIKNSEYWNLFYQKQYDRFTDTYTKKLGWNTNAKTKRIMINKLTEFVREKYLMIYSDLVIGEMFTYVINENGSTNAQEGSYDDAVMAVAIMLQLLLEFVGGEYEPGSTDKNEKQLINSEIVDELFESPSVEVELSK